MSILRRRWDIYIFFIIVSLIKICDSTLAGENSLCSDSVESAPCCFNKSELRCNSMESTETDDKCHPRSDCLYTKETAVEIQIRVRNPADGDLWIIIRGRCQMITLKVTPEEKSLLFIISREKLSCNQKSLQEHKSVCTSRGWNSSTSSEDYKLELQSQPNGANEIFRFGMTFGEAKNSQSFVTAAVNPWEHSNLTFHIGDFEYNCDFSPNVKVGRIKCLEVYSRGLDIHCNTAVNSDSQPMSDFVPVCPQNGTCLATQEDPTDMQSKPAPRLSPIDVTTLILVILLLVVVLVVLFKLWTSMATIREDLRLLISREPVHTSLPLANVPKGSFASSGEKTFSRRLPGQEIASPGTHFPENPVQPVGKSRFGPATPMGPQPLNNNASWNFDRRKSENFGLSAFHSKVEQEGTDSTEEHDYDTVEDLVLANNVSPDVGTPVIQMPNGQIPQVNQFSSRESINSLYMERKKLEESKSEETVEV